MKISAYPCGVSGMCLVLIASLVAGSTLISGCSDPKNTVIIDPSTSKNKRTGRIEQLKGGGPNGAVKKVEP